MDHAVVTEDAADEIFFNQSATIFVFYRKRRCGQNLHGLRHRLGLAEQGKRVLLISTDPASNLDEVLETPLSSTPRP
jgi:arsenite/tail-anchored protein-transporting ATPase